MGRAKLNMELISKEKSRNLTFKKRKEGLIRKLHEFTTLCDVSACMIMYGPNSKAAESEIWPRNAEEINRIIGIYKVKNKDSGNKTYCLADFFHDRKRKIEEELAKLRKKNMETKYPTWLDAFNFMTEAQLREFASSLCSKAAYVKSRIEALRRKKQQGFGLNFIDFSHSQTSFLSPGMRGIELQVMNHQQAVEMPAHYPIPSVDHGQDLHSNNSMMMLLMNENDQFGGGASSFQAASFKHQVFYESRVGAFGVPDPTVIHRSLQYYVPPPALPLVQGAPRLPLQLGDDGLPKQEDSFLNNINSHRGRY